MKVTFPNLVADIDRHGTVRYYLRRKGQRKIRLRATPGTEEFLEEYKRALRGEIEPAIRLKRPAEGSLAWLRESYLSSAEFKQLGPATQQTRRLILDGICTSKVGDVERGTLPFALMQPRHIRQLRDEKADRPEAANSRVKALRQLFAWAKENEYIKSNPALDVPKFGSSSEGFHTWTREEVKQFEAHHPAGSQARLALALLLFLGVRRSDVVKLGRWMERDGFLYFEETKGAKRRGKGGRPAPGPKRRKLPILPPLRGVIDATPSAGMFYLLTKFGRPFTSNGFGNKFRGWCDQAGLHHCSAHGLRKAGATIAAENGAKPHQLMALFGWSNIKEANHYTTKVDRDRLALEAAQLLVLEEQNDVESVPPFDEVAEVGQRGKK